MNIFENRDCLEAMKEMGDNSIELAIVDPPIDVSVSIMYISRMDRKKYDRERKKEQRRLNTPYAQRVREQKRSEPAKLRRQELRQTPENKEIEKLYAREYRKRPGVIRKNKARHKAKWALINGVIKRPSTCEVCGNIDTPLRDGRSSLRMDHYLGYDEGHELDVKFICVKCDGIQLRNE